MNQDFDKEGKKAEGFSLVDFVNTNPVTSFWIVLYFSTIAKSIFDAVKLNSLELGVAAGVSFFFFWLLVFLTKGKLTELVDNSPILTFLVLCTLSGIAKGIFSVL